MFERGAIGGYRCGGYALLTKHMFPMPCPVRIGQAFSAKNMSCDIVPLQQIPGGRDLTPFIVGIQYGERRAFVLMNWSRLLFFRKDTDYGSDRRYACTLIRSEGSYIHQRPDLREDGKDRPAGGYRTSGESGITVLCLRTLNTDYRSTAVMSFTHWNSEILNSVVRSGRRGIHNPHRRPRW